MLKLVGAIFVVAACTAYGFSKADKYNRRVIQLRDLQLAIQLLQTEIGYCGTPLPIAFERVSNKLITVLKEFFAETANLLQSRQGYTVSQAVEKVVSEVLAKSDLNEEDKEVILDLGKSLGISDREDQKKYLSFALGQLKKAETNAVAERACNAKMWRYLGFLGGLTVVILIF